MLKIVESSVTGLPQAYKYTRKVLRVVRVQNDRQRGWLSEKGVSLLWESPHFDPNSKGPGSNYTKFFAQAWAFIESVDANGAAIPLVE